MFRRIEFIHDGDFAARKHDWRKLPPEKTGIMGFSHEEIIDAWFDKLRGPCGKSIPKNARFYFTELGWREVGKFVVEACIKTNQKYRIIKIKETDAQVCWRCKETGYEVAVQSKKKKYGFATDKIK